MAAHMTEKKFKKGDVREDGKIFRGYVGARKHLEWWVTPEHFQAIEDRARARVEAKKAALVIKPRVLKRGDVRSDGMVFYKYSSQCANGEWWMTPERYAAKLQAVKAHEARPEVKERAKEACKKWSKAKGERYHTEWRAKRRAEFDAHRRASLLRRGAVNAEGLVFHSFCITSPGFERWVTPEYMDKRLKDERATARRQFEKNRDNPDAKRKRREYTKRHRQRNLKEAQAYARAYSKKRKAEDPSWHVTLKLRGRLFRAVHNSNLRKKYTRGKDKPTVAWLLWLADKQGIDISGGDYHIDHLYPARFFDFTTAEGQKNFNAPENTWWLPAQENLSKNDNDPTPEQIATHAALLSEYRQTKTK